jgi:chaperone required for assembly of F1-ATPase
LNTIITVSSPDGLVYSLNDDGEIIIEQPKLWWPMVMGNSALRSIRRINAVMAKELDTWKKAELGLEP